MKVSNKFVTDNFKKNVKIDIDKYIELGGFVALKKAISNGSEFVINEIKKANLLGRGGAAYPTWKKLEAAHNRVSNEKYLICNADEGEPGTFKDRDLLILDPYKVIEGMIITGFTIGSSESYIYVREEYDYVQLELNKAIKKANEYGYLGNDILGSEFNFNIHVHTGAGSYNCGETTALIESMHGRSCRSRLKIPRVGEKGYKGKPTLINNVETLAYITAIIQKGSDEYIKLGTDKSIGTKVIALCGNVVNSGTYEVPFGVTINEIINNLGGGIRNNNKVKFVQAGGASCSIIPAEMFDLEYSYESFEENDFQIGSGSMVVCDENIKLIDYLLATQKFFSHESCGKCTPCREGNKRLVEILTKISNGNGKVEDIDKLESLSLSIKRSSLCGLGQTSPNALLSVIKNYRDDCIMYINKGDINER